MNDNQQTQKSFEEVQTRFNTSIDAINESINDRNETYKSALSLCGWGLFISFFFPTIGLPIVGATAIATLIVKSQDKTLKSLHETKVKLCQDFASVQTLALPAPERPALPMPKPPVLIDVKPPAAN